tara:strand:+ start:1098 stop:1340 length:243 start_codon:yes stop_codon:yes gene_type:complete
MKSLTLIIFTISIVFLTIGYMELKINEKQNQKIIEYRFIPRSMIEDQVNPVNLETSFVDMFKRDNPFLYQNSGLENTNLV